MAKVFVHGRLIRNICLYILPLFLCVLTIENASAQEKRMYTLTLTVGDGTETLPMAVCRIPAIELVTSADINGVASFRDLPRGTYRVEVSYVGYEKSIQTVTMDADKSIRVDLQETSLSLKEVTVVAKVNENSLSSSAIIGRQAIDHVQAVSLADLVQLIPGQLFSKTDLTSKSYMNLRTVATATQNATFGTAILLDGVPISANADLGTTGEYTSVTTLGADLRQVSTDDIESVEVISGIPSVEYGDLTSGIMKVNTKKGYTPFQVRGKINPTTTNVSVGKGMRVGNTTGIINATFDYAQAWSDPRKKTQSFDRYNASATYTNTFFKKWYTTTSLRYSGIVDWDGNDPDVVSDGTYDRTAQSAFTLNHNGRINLNRMFSRVIKYTISGGINRSHYRKTTIVNNNTGYLPIITAMETGYYEVPYETTNYTASGGTKSNARNLLFKASNSFFLKQTRTNHAFNMGAEYRWESNNGRGYYNDDDRYPLKPNSSTRPRAYSEIPALNQLAAYLEDNFTWMFSDTQSLRIQLGGRFQMMQPGKSEQVYSFSPRVNASVDLTNWFTLRGGYGLNEKAPGMIHLYPAAKYTDRVAAKYTPADKDEAMVVYHTNVYEVKRTEGLKNIKNEKKELGFDIKLPEERRFGVTLYHDKIKNGFEAAKNTTTYTTNYYDETSGLTIVSGQPTTIDYTKPARTDTVFITTGEVANTAVQVNKGGDFNFNMGTIPSIRTSFILSGAYTDSESYSKGEKISSPQNIPVSYAQAETVPFKLLYPASGNSHSSARRFSTTLRAVCNIPELKMVVSLGAQVIWYNRSYSYNPAYDPIAWIDSDMSYHEITQEMLDDEDYTIKGVKLSEQRKNASNETPTRSPKTWLVNLRLNKELGKSAAIAFYVNNFTFYEPYKRSSTSGTLNQYNTGSFTFGGELSFKF